MVSFVGWAVFDTIEWAYRWQQKETTAAQNNCGAFWHVVCILRFDIFSVYVQLLIIMILSSLEQQLDNIKRLIMSLEKSLPSPIVEH